MAPIPEEKECDPNHTDKNISENSLPTINFTVESDSSNSDDLEDAQFIDSGYQPIPQNDLDGLYKFNEL